MGFYSWLTSDTKKSIPAVASGRKIKPVYLLQPHGQPPIKEDLYTGDGWFGGVNASDWLAEMNAEPLGVELPEDQESRFLLGVHLEHGRVLRDTVTGIYWHIFHSGPKVLEGRFFAGTYADIIPEFGKSANDLVEDGRLECHRVADIVGLPYPLKFSFDPSAIYEDLPEAERCPEQGYFYDDGES